MVCRVACLIFLAVGLATAFPPTKPGTTVPFPKDEVLEITDLDDDMLDFDWKHYSGVNATLQSGKERLWPSSDINYVFEDGFPEEIKTRVRLAAEMIHKESCVRFHEKTKLQLKREELYFRIMFEKDICRSAVGITCKDTPEDCNPKMKLGQSCPVGSITHELLHMLGYIHEHNRNDRDKFVEIIFENINSSISYARRNFMLTNYSLTLDTPYDYGSIMHYPKSAFAYIGKETIRPLKPLAKDVNMGQRNGLSMIDKQRLNEHYCKTSK